MSLLGNVLGAALGGGAAGGANPIQGLIMNMLSAPAPTLESSTPQATGLTMLMEKFESAGAGSIMQSWISNEANQMITPDNLHQILGATHVEELAGKVGIDSNTLVTMLAQHLPDVINAMTPHGTLPPAAA